jgi:hypothetical protein
MPLCVQAFWLPKTGNTVEEYEDAFECAPQVGRLAIADGATESSFAGRWARSLVQAYVATSPVDATLGVRKLQEWLEPLQREWCESINWEQLPWFAEEKARVGAFSTFLGLDLKIQDYGCDLITPYRWNAVAVGDSCLFQVRNGSLLIAFPMRRAKEFSNSPLLLSSNPVHNQYVWDGVLSMEGDYIPDDLFLLATDALAHWFLARYEVGENPWAILSNIEEQADFEDFVTHLRQERLIRNDDTTLLTIRLIPDISAGGEQEEGSGS